MRVFSCVCARRSKWDLCVEDIGSWREKDLSGRQRSQVAC